MDKKKFVRWKSTYNFSTKDYNLIDDIYSSIKDDDRIIFISRHAMRWPNFWIEGWLTDEWIEQARSLWKRLSWWRFKNPSNDFYWSTDFKRTHETSFYIWAARWYPKFLNNNDGDWWQDNNEILHPILVLEYDYFWMSVAHWYENNRKLWIEKSLNLISTVCNLTDWHEFSRLTTHDVVVIPLLSWLSEENLHFKREEWVNYLSWVAIIVHKNNEYELYPFRSLEETSMVLTEWDDC